MIDDPIVYGITADLANEFNPDQWVNLYQLDPVQKESQLHFVGKYQVKDLAAILADLSAQTGSDQAGNFALEPLDEQGNAISVQQALNQSEDSMLS